MQINVEISDDDDNIIKQKPWFKIIDKKQNNIQFDKSDKYMFQDFCQNLQESQQQQLQSLAQPQQPQQPQSIHIIVPLFQDQYKLYQNIIKTGQQNKPFDQRNIFFVSEIIKSGRDDSNIDEGLTTLIDLQSPQFNGKQFQVHTVFLGQSFLSQYLEKKVKRLTKLLEKQEYQRFFTEEQIEDCDYTQDQQHKICSQYIKELPSKINELKKDQATLLDEFNGGTNYVNKFINYDFGNIQDDKKITYFPYFANDIIKLLYMLRQYKVVVKQYDMPSINYVKHLEQNLGLIM